LAVRDDERGRRDKDAAAEALTTELGADGDVLRPPCSPDTFGVPHLRSPEPAMGEPAMQAVGLASIPPEELVPMLVQRAAVGGDYDNAAMHLLLGGTELRGGTLDVRADKGRVAVSLRVPSSASAAHWEEKIRDRLAQKGLSIADLVVR
jgi:hypothetical protein